MKTRTDPHRPGAIIPVDYEHACSYSLPGVDDPGYMDDLAWLRRQPGVRFFGSHAAGHCDVCGQNNFRHGDVWIYKPTGEHLHVGHQCASKYGMMASREAWEQWHRNDRKRRAVAIKEEANKKARLKVEADAAAYRAANPELDAALRVEHPILQDMAGKIVRFGSLSEKQIAFALKLAAETIERANRPAEVRIPAPTGRVQFKGEVVSVKAHESDWGVTTKITVKVATPEGTWLAWMTCPSGNIQRGDTIEVKATLTPGKDSFFAFGKRPVLIDPKEVAQ